MPEMERDPVAAPQAAPKIGGEARRGLLALALGIALGVIARLFESKEARAWRESSET